MLAHYVLIIVSNSGSVASVPARDTVELIIGRLLHVLDALRSLRYGLDNDSATSGRLLLARLLRHHHLQNHRHHQQHQ